MTVEKAIAVGQAGNELSKKLMDTNEVSTERTTVAVGSGAAIGAAVGGAVTVGAAAVGVATAPITVPLAVAGAICAGIFSLFD